jgi:hypothetical protein
MINIRCIPEKLLILSSIFYYYVAALLPNNINQFLAYSITIGSFLAFYVVVRYLLINNITKQIVIYLIIVIATLIISYIMGWSNLVWLALMTVPLLRMERDSFIKSVFYFSLILFVITIGLSILGYLPLEYINFSGGIEERYGAIKYSLGFDGPNQASFSFFTVLLSGLYTYGSSRMFVLVSTVATLAVGFATGSRTGMACGLLFIFVYLRVKHKDKLVDKGVIRIVPYLFVILAIFSFFTAILLQNSEAMNKTLSGRPELIGYYIKSDYMPTLFGNDEVYNKAEHQTPPLDNFPIYILGKYGIVVFILFALLFYFSLRNEMSDKIKVVFIFILLYGLTEAFFDIPAKNFLLPIMFYSLLIKPKRES